jgi:hypothetical protein
MTRTNAIAKVFGDTFDDWAKFGQTSRTDDCRTIVHALCDQSPDRPKRSSAGSSEPLEEMRAIGYELEQPFRTLRSG